MRSSTIGPPPDGDATTLIVTGIPWRTGWQYAERGFRHLYWDAGTMLAQTLALAGEPRLYTRFPDAQITRLVGADGMHEFPLAIVALNHGKPRIEPTGDAVDRHRGQAAAGRVPTGHACPAGG